MNDTHTTEQVMARLQVLRDQLDHAVQKWNGKTTITQSDLDVIKQAIAELKK
jgi:predicted small metal-binding protein